MLPFVGDDTGVGVGVSVGATGDGFTVATTTMTSSISMTSVDKLQQFLHHLFTLLSPKTYWTIMELNNKGDLNKFSTQQLVSSLMSLILPILILRCIDILFSYSVQWSTSSSSTTTTPTTMTSILSIFKAITVEKSRRSPFLFGKGNINVWIPFVLLSPWTWQCFRNVMIQYGYILKSLIMYRVGRSMVDDDAIQTLYQRIQSHRAYRTNQYDVFLPPPPPPSSPTSPPSSMSFKKEMSSHAKNNDNANNERGLHHSHFHQRAIIFFPGALVPHTAYANAASMLSDRGFVVVVPSMEPFRLAYHRFNAGYQDLIRTVRQVQKKLSPLLLYAQSSASPPSSSSLSLLPKSVEWEWTLMGHSMGTFAAMYLIDQIIKKEQKQKQEQQRQRSRRQRWWWNSPSSPPSQLHNRTINDDYDSLNAATMTTTFSNKLIFWGMAAFAQMTTDLSSYDHLPTSSSSSLSSSPKLNICIIQGSDDMLLSLLSPYQKQFDSKFPKHSTTIQYIQGGTHGGFGNYHPKVQQQTTKKSKTQQNDDDDDDDSNDGKSKQDNHENISKHEQQQRACQLTVEYILSKSSSSSSSSN